VTDRTWGGKEEGAHQGGLVRGGGDWQWGKKVNKLEWWSPVGSERNSLAA
jgi:hypothetical protein